MKRLFYSVLTLIALPFVGTIIGLLVNGIIIFISWGINWEFFWQLPRVGCVSGLLMAIVIVSTENFSDLYNNFGNEKSE